LPINEDPDSFVQKYGQQGFTDFVAKALTIVEYELQLLKSHNDLSQTDGRLRYGNEAIKILRQLDTSVEIDYYSKMVAGETGINQEVIRREVMRSKTRQSNNPSQLLEPTPSEVAPLKIPKAYKKAQELAIRYCLKTPEIIDDFPMDYLTDPFYQELLRTLSEKRKTGIRIEVNQIMSHFEDSEEVKKIVEFMMNEDEVSRSDYQDALEIMNRFYNEAQLDKLSEQIKRESSNGNDDAVARLTNQFIEIKKMMKENGRH
jgi:DNA primase